MNKCREASSSKKSSRKIDIGNFLSPGAMSISSEAHILDKNMASFELN